MYKKIMKTMIFIVFLAFIGICNVYAASNDVAICDYEYKYSGSNCDGKCAWFDDDYSDKLVVTIKDSGTLTIQNTKGEDEFNLDSLLNWNKSVGGFKAYDYFKEKNDCPDYLIDNYEQNKDDIIYFSDKDHYDAVLDEAFASDNRDDDLNVYVKTGITHVTPTPRTNTNTSKKNSQTKNYTDPTPETPEPLSESGGSYSCGDKFMTGIPVRIPKFTKFIYNFLQFMVPIILIVLGTIDLVKSITGGKEDEIKKGQQVFIKRLITGFLVFFSFAIVKILVGIVFPNSSKVISCVNCFINGGDYCVPETDDLEYSYSNKKTFEKVTMFNEES